MNRFLLVNKKALPCSALMFSTIISHIRVRDRYLFFSILSAFLFILTATGIHAQSNLTDQQKMDYQKIIADRSAKIVNSLSITDSVQYNKTMSVIASEYFALATLQDQHTAAVAEVKKHSAGLDQQAEALKALDEKKSAALMQLHNGFIAQLNENLSAEQVDKVKDGLTYKVFPLTYAAYLDEVPTLTTQQKDKIYAWLKEARELAMDAESSDKKHAVFGKYKGRINNYLSAAGYDMKKEGEEWQKRIQAAKDRKQTQN